MTFFIVDNFLPHECLQSVQLVDKNALQTIKAAQRDHVSIELGGPVSDADAVTRLFASMKIF